MAVFYKQALNICIENISMLSYYHMINVELNKNNNENNLSLLRRFSKRIKSSGIIPRMRSIRYNSRVESKFTKKKKTLKTIRKKEEIDELIKMGKMLEKRTR